MQALRVLTYNVHYGIGRDGVYDLDRIIRVLREADADIVALQEVDNGVARTGRDNQTKRIADALGFDAHHCVNRRIGSGEFGITTLSRFPLTGITRHDLTYSDRHEPRGVLRADVELADGGFVHVFNVHLGLSARERQFQRRRLLSESILLDVGLEEPVLILGDFNDRPIPVVHRSFRSHFEDAFTAAAQRGMKTFRWGPVRLKLDHIYFSHQFRLSALQVINGPPADVASDHSPLMADLILHN